MSRASDRITSWDVIRTGSGPGPCHSFLSATVSKQTKNKKSTGTTGKITCTGLYKKNGSEEGLIFCDLAFSLLTLSVVTCLVIRMA